MKPLKLSETVFDIQALSDRYGIEGDMVEGGAFGNGLINDTLVAGFVSGDEKKQRYIFQRINHHVFKDPVSLMQNVERVCDHIRQKLFESQCDNIERKALTLLRDTSDGATLVRDTKGNFWRAYNFIENSTSFDTVENVEQAYEAAKKFGEFQRLLEDLKGERLVETIPDFHNTPKRFEVFEKAVAEDVVGRVADCQEEIDFVLSQREMVSKLLNLHHQGLIPERIIHNDTKLGNVLLCDKSNRGLCVVDLDTVMPGLALYDFGDLVRTCVSPGHENDRDPFNQDVRIPMFRALVDGYLSEVADVLTETEIENLAFAGRLITFEVGLRFLTDHLQNDIYFGSKRPNHNLERSRTQFALARIIEEKDLELSAIVSTAAKQFRSAQAI